MRQTRVNISEIADRVASAMPRSDPTSPQVAVTLYRLLAEGHPVTVEHLARTLNLPGDRVSEVLSPYPVFYDEHGAVIGFGGLTVAEMPPHRSRVDGRPSTPGVRGTASSSRASSGRSPTSRRSTHSLAPPSP